MINISSLPEIEDEEKLPINSRLERFSVASTKFAYDTIFLTGGTSFGMATNRLYKMEDSTNGWKWSRKTYPELLQSRHSHSTTIAGRHLAVVGGRNEE